MVLRPPMTLVGFRWWFAIVFVGLLVLVMNPHMFLQHFELIHSFVVARCFKITADPTSQNRLPQVKPWPLTGPRCSPNMWWEKHALVLRITHWKMAQKSASQPKKSYKWSTANTAKSQAESNLSPMVNSQDVHRFSQEITSKPRFLGGTSAPFIAARSSSWSFSRDCFRPISFWPRHWRSRMTFSSAVAKKCDLELGFFDVSGQKLKSVPSLGFLPRTEWNGIYLMIQTDLNISKFGITRLMH